MSQNLRNIVLLGLTLLPAAAQCKVYEYVQYQDPDGFALAGTPSRIDTDRGTSVGIHANHQLEICATEAAFHCVYGSVFNFAVPKHALRVGEAWDYHHFSYHVADRRVLSLVRAQATQIAGKVLARGNIASTSEFRKVEEYVDYLASAGGNADEINGLNALLADFVAKRSNSQQERRRPGNIPSPTGRKSRVRPCD